MSQLQFTWKGGGEHSLGVCGFRLRAAALCPLLHVCITDGRDGNRWNDGRSQGQRWLSLPLVVV